MKHHFDWMQFLILSGAIAAPVAQAAENASATNGPNPFINPAFDLAIFGALAQAAKASETAEPVPTLAQMLAQNAGGVSAHAMRQVPPVKPLA